MTSIQRLKSSLEHREPDHVPYDLAGTTVTSISGTAYINAMKHRGYNPWFDTDKIVDHVSQIIIPPEQSLQQLKSDTRRLGLERELSFSKILMVSEQKQSFTDQYGCSWEMNTETDHYFNQTTFPMEAFEELSDAMKNLTIPDLDLYRDHMYSLLDSQREVSKSSAFVADRCCAGLMEMSLRFRGYEKCYMDMILDPESLRSMVSLIADHKIQYWDIMGDYIISRGLQENVLVVSECDDLGSQQSLLISRSMLSDIFFPSMKRYLAFIKKKMPWVKILFHSCGAVREIIPDFIDMGVDILNPVQYTASGMELAGLKRDFGDDLVFWGGGIDTQSILAEGTAAQVIDEVKRTIDILAPGGGFVFAPVHNIQEDVPPENFWAMWDTWNEYGASI